MENKGRKIGLWYIDDTRWPISR